MTFSHALHHLITFFPQKAKNQHHHQKPHIKENWIITTGQGYHHHVQRKKAVSMTSASSVAFIHLTNGSSNPSYEN